MECQGVNLQPPTRVIDQLRRADIRSIGFQMMLWWILQFHYPGCEMEQNKILVFKRMCLSPVMQMARKMKTHLGSFPRHSSEKCVHLLRLSVAAAWLDNACSAKAKHLTLTRPQMQQECFFCFCFFGGRCLRGKRWRRKKWVQTRLLPKRLQISLQPQSNYHWIVTLKITRDDCQTFSLCFTSSW